MFQGCGTALVTPFRSDLELDEEALRRLIQRQLAAGIDFLVPCGTTGENPTLSQAELRRVVEITIEEAQSAPKKIPVLAGAGSNDTRRVVAMARDYEAMGADGLLIVTPYYNKPTDEGLYAHYSEVARHSRLPIVVYNVPGRTNVNVAPKVLARLAEIDTVVGVKEAAGNISQAAEIFQVVPDGFLVLSGDDVVTLAIMALGGAGVVSVVANQVPYAMARLVALCRAGDYAAAREVHRRLHALMEINFIESNPGPVKASLALMGLIEPAYRLPIVPPQPESLRRIEAALLHLGLIPDSEQVETAVALEG
jgi:4-hydroxy-tetrahydrodipicolinate synthase